MIFHIFLVMFAALAAIYVGVGVAGHIFFAPLNKKLQSDTYKVKVQQFKKSMLQTFKHKIFPRMILHTCMCIVDDNTRMVWETYRYDIDATMMFVALKRNGNFITFETSIKLNNNIISESVKKYQSSSEALDVFDKFCHTKVDIYQLAYNS